MTDRDGDDSYRRVLTSTMVTGGATIAVAVISLFRSKGLALMVGPAGIGAMGILNSAMTLLASIACLGLTFSGVRQIAVTTGAAQRHVRLLIWAMCLAGAMLVAVVVLVADRRFLDWIGMNALGGAKWWVAAGLVAMVVAAVQMTVLQGARQIRRLAEVRIAGALVGALAGVAAVWQFGDSAIPFAVIAVPIGNILAGLLRPARIVTSENSPNLSLGVVRTLLALGLATLVTGTAASAWQLAVRSIVADHLSLEFAGLYQAAFSLSAMNIALVLGALGADYFPRLSEAASRKDEVERVINQQFSAAIFLSVPLIFALISFAPIALKILYSSKFEGAWQLLQLQALGDLVKIPGWICVYALIALNKNRLYLVIDLGFCSIITIISLLLIDSFGLNGAGMGYLIAYALYSLVAFFALTRLGYQIRRSLALGTAATILLGCSIVAISALNSSIGLIYGALLTAAAAFAASNHFRGAFVHRSREHGAQDQ